MKFSQASLSLIILTIVFTIGCKREKSDQINPSSNVQSINTEAIAQCHRTENPFPSQISANIEGTWVWQSQRCPMTGDSTMYAGKHVVLTFNDGGLFKVFESSRLISEGEWQLVQSLSGEWQIQTSVASEYISGYILLCKNELLFSTIHLDGCEYLFVRK